MYNSLKIKNIYLLLRLRFDTDMFFVVICNRNQYCLSFLCPSAYFPTKTFKSFGSSIFWIWMYLV